MVWIVKVNVGTAVECHRGLMPLDTGNGWKCKIGPINGAENLGMQSWFFKELDGFAQPHCSIM